MIPLRFLPGARVKAWSWIAWAALLVGVLYAFVHVLLLPESGYLGRSTAASVTVTLALFVAFGVLSGLFWLYFRLRPTAEEAVGPEAAVPVPATAGAPDAAAAGTPESPTASEEPRINVDAQGQAVPGPRVPRQGGPPSEES